ncbi:MAG TPA: DUF5916 domain-containing protein [Vicinamibacterales bacterium]|nr:DUF5916 domain-containing protein [Vicinamibacterales bacterium]
MPCSSVRACAVLIVAVVLAGAVVRADERAAAAPDVELRATRTAVPPSIDGLLDDEAWRGSPLPLGEWRSYNPLHGDSIPQQTRVWAAYDDRYLYFAFDCQDPEPDRVKTSIARRDNVWQDDWVGLSIDALGTGQVAYHMMVNPSGVQLDLLNSVSGGEDESPDWIWDSAGRRTDRGYAVEIRLPLQSIRFARGEQVRTGILFWRRVSRLGVSVSWPALEPGAWVFQKHAPLIFERLDAPLTREVIPAATYTWNETRDRPDAWTTGINKGDVGFSSRIGLTPAVTLDATLNPDFSQVESDAFQVEVNRRFPVFFPEKRPFFMEGADIFRLAGIGNGDASMVSAVHTRQIVDPLFGFKLTGGSGRVSFGTLSASDESADRDLADGDPRRGHARYFNIARGRYSLGTGTFVGALVTDTRFAGDRNSVLGADLAWRIRDNQSFSVTGLRSWTSDEAGSRAGSAVQMNYSVSSRRATFASQLEHYDRSFVMETAFYNRVGFTSGWAYVDLNFYPDKDRHPWLRRVQPFTFTQGGRDRAAGGDDLLNVTGVRVYFTRQGFFRIDRFFGREPWARRRFDIGRWRMFGSVQLLRWLYLYGYYHAGNGIFYESEAPFGGKVRQATAEVRFQPTGRLTQSISYTRDSFERPTGERVYRVDILNTNTTYQFTRAFALRGIVQYDSSRSQVLTDFLSSYELRPGTVFYAGYGSLLERREHIDGEWVLGRGAYDASRRGVFFKASYLFRF